MGVIIALSLLLCTVHKFLKEYIEKYALQYITAVQYVRFNIIVSSCTFCTSSSWTLNRTLACSTPAVSPTGLSGSAHEAGLRPAPYRPPLDSNSAAVK